MCSFCCQEEQAIYRSVSKYKFCYHIEQPNMRTYTILIKVLKEKHRMERSLQITARCDVGQPGTANLQLKFSNSIWNAFCNIHSFCFGVIDIVLPLHRCDGELIGCTSVSLGVKNRLNTSARQAKKPHCKAPKSSVCKFSNGSWETPIKFGFSSSAPSTSGSFLALLFIYFFMIHLSSTSEGSIEKITGAKCRFNCTLYNRSK